MAHVAFRTVMEGYEHDSLFKVSEKTLQNYSDANRLSRALSEW